MSKKVWTKIQNELTASKNPKNQSKKFHTLPKINKKPVKKYAVESLKTKIGQNVHKNVQFWTKSDKFWTNLWTPI